jgi:hypothetical protein
MIKIYIPNWMSSGEIYTGRMMPPEVLYGRLMREALDSFV